jgi:hypothetical protein
MITRILPPPAAPPNVPQGLDRGGVFDAPWEPGQYIGAMHPDLPFDASTPRKVPMSRDYRSMKFTSTLPTPVGQFTELVGPAPLPIKAYNPRNYPHAGGIFAGVGQIQDMAFARPEWTKWQLSPGARRGMGGCGCSNL